MYISWFAYIEKGKIIITNDEIMNDKVILHNLETTDKFINKLIELRNRLANEHNQIELRSK